MINKKIWTRRARCRQVSQLNRESEAEKQRHLAAQRTLGARSDGGSKGGAAWGDDEVEVLIKAVNLFPAGTMARSVPHSLFCGSDPTPLGDRSVPTPTVPSPSTAGQSPLPLLQVSPQSLFCRSVPTPPSSGQFPLHSGTGQSPLLLLQVSSHSLFCRAVPTPLWDSARPLSKINDYLTEFTIVHSNIIWINCKV